MKETTMPVTNCTRRTYSRPAYYLGRPAGWWITALAPGCRRPAGQTIRPSGPSTVKEPQ